jgi:hypothetical protein
MSDSAKYWLKLAFSVLVLGGVLITLRDRWHEFPATLRSVSLAAVVASTVLNILGSILLPAIMTQLALKTERLRLPLLHLVRMNFILRFYSLVLPKGGVLAMRWNMYRRGGSGGDAFALVIFEKLVMVSAYILPAAVCLALEQARLGALGRPLLVVTTVMAVVSFAVILPFFNARFLAPFTWLLKRLRHRSTMRDKLTSVIESIQAYRSLTTHDIVLLSAASLAGCFLFVMSAYVLADGMELGLSLLAVGWMRTLTFVLTLAPITVGGLGIRELSYIAFMRLYGVEQATALVYGLILFTIQVVIGLAGFALDLLQRKHSSGIVSS